MNVPHRFLIAVILAFAFSAAGAATGSPSKLARAFSPEMIGADLAYFQQVTGPAWQHYENTKTYKLDGCVVTAAIANGSVRSLRLELSPKCTFNLNAFLPNFHGKFPSPNKMTFGEFDALTDNTGRFMADCLVMCGNGADPVVFEHWYGSRADQVLEVMLEAVQANIPTIDAADKWQDAMTRGEGQTWVLHTQFNCGNNKYNQVAHRAFRNISISAITIGYDIERPRCRH